MYQLQNIDYLYRISTMTGSSKLVTVCSGGQRLP